MIKTISCFLLLLLAILQFRLWQGAGGVRQVLRLKQAIALQTVEVEQLTERNRQLVAEVKALKTYPEAFEDRARTELGMIKQGETFCLIVEPAR